MQINRICALSGSFMSTVQYDSMSGKCFIMDTR